MKMSEATTVLNRHCKRGSVRASTASNGGNTLYFAGKHACFSRGAFLCWKRGCWAINNTAAESADLYSWDVTESLVERFFFHCLSHHSPYWIKMLRVRVIPRRFFLQSFVACKFKSTSASESIQTEFELNNGDVPDSFRGTAFAASNRGSFFQEAPRLRKQFSGDLFLQSYLKRILPQEVGLLFNMISSFNTKVICCYYF